MYIAQTLFKMERVVSRFTGKRSAPDGGDKPRKIVVTADDKTMNKYDNGFDTLKGKLDSSETKYGVACSEANKASWRFDTLKKDVSQAQESLKFVIQKYSQKAYVADKDSKLKEVCDAKVTRARGLLVKYDELSLYKLMPPSFYDKIYIPGTKDMPRDWTQSACDYDKCCEHDKPCGAC